MKIGIVGYGNLGKACEKLLLEGREHSLAGIFTRRAQGSIKAISDKVYPLQRLPEFEGEIDALLLCIGSRSDSFNIAPNLARRFNTVDCFDTHERAEEYVSLMNKSGTVGSHASICMCGWDPGILSQIRAVFSSVFSLDNTYTYWGRGISQGHSEAVRRIIGVTYAACYTVPDEKTMRLAKMGVVFQKNNIHRRECFVVAEGDREKIEDKIKNMPYYFKGTDTRVYFITEREFFLNHSTIYHRGRVIAADKSGLCATLDIEIPSNPDFTARVMLTYLTAISKLVAGGNFGAKTPLDIPLSYLINNTYLCI